MKYKVFGIGLVGFLVFLLYLLLRPKEGIDPLLFKSYNIDSIRTYNFKNKLVINNQLEINQVCSLLQNANKIKIDNHKGYVDFYDLYFYIRNEKVPIDLRIHQHLNEGIILSVNDFDYRGEAMDSLIKKLNSK